MTNIGSPSPSPSQSKRVPSWMEGGEETKTASIKGRGSRFFVQHRKAKATREPSEEITNSEVSNVSGAAEGETVNDRRNLENFFDGAKLQKQYVESCALDKRVLGDSKKLEEIESGTLIDELSKFKSFDKKTSHHILKLYMKIVRAVVTKKVKQATEFKDLGVKDSTNPFHRNGEKRNNQKVEKAVTKKTNAILDALAQKYKGYELPYPGEGALSSYQYEEDKNMSKGSIIETKIELSPSDPERLHRLKLFGGDQDWTHHVFGERSNQEHKESDMRKAARNLIETMRGEISKDLRDLNRCGEEDLKAKYQKGTRYIPTPFVDKKRDEGRALAITAIRKEKFPDVSEDKFLFSPENALKYTALERKLKDAEYADRDEIKDPKYTAFIDGIKAQIDNLETTVPLQEGSDKFKNYAEVQLLKRDAAGVRTEVREANARQVNEKQKIIDQLTGENLALKKQVDRMGGTMPKTQDVGTQTDDTPIEADAIPTETNPNGVSTTTSPWQVLADSADSSGLEETKKDDIKSLETFGSLVSSSAIAAMAVNAPSEGTSDKEAVPSEISDIDNLFDARRNNNETSDAYQKRLLAHFQINKTGDDAAFKTLQQFPKLKELGGGIDSHVSHLAYKAFLRVAQSAIKEKIQNVVCLSSDEDIQALKGDEKEQGNLAARVWHSIMSGKYREKQLKGKNPGSNEPEKYEAKEGDGGKLVDAVDLDFEPSYHDALAFRLRAFGGSRQWDRLVDKEQKEQGKNIFNAIQDELTKDIEGLAEDSVFKATVKKFASGQSDITKDFYHKYDAEGEARTLAKLRDKFTTEGRVQGEYALTPEAAISAYKQEKDQKIVDQRADLNNKTGQFTRKLAAAREQQEQATAKQEMNKGLKGWSRPIEPSAGESFVPEIATQEGSVEAAKSTSVRRHILSSLRRGSKDGSEIDVNAGLEVWQAGNGNPSAASTVGDGFNPSFGATFSGMAVKGVEGVEFADVIVPKRKRMSIGGYKFGPRLGPKKTQGDMGIEGWSENPNML